MRSKAFVGPAKESVILRQATLGGHELIVLGTKAWSGDPLHFGHSAEALIGKAPGYGSAHDSGRSHSKILATKLYMFVIEDKRPSNV